MLRTEYFLEYVCNWLMRAWVYVIITINIRYIYSRLLLQTHQSLETTSQLPNVEQPTQHKCLNNEINSYKRTREKREDYRRQAAAATTIITLTQSITAQQLQNKKENVKAHDYQLSVMIWICNQRQTTNNQHQQQQQKSTRTLFVTQTYTTLTLCVCMSMCVESWGFSFRCCCWIHSKSTIQSVVIFKSREENPGHMKISQMIHK